MGKIRDTYKLNVKRNGVIIMRLCTDDVQRMSNEVKAHYPDAVIERVGRKTTRKAALEWSEKHSQ